MRKVLIIDDDAPTRLLLRLILESEGYEVFEAHDGVSGVECFAEQPADAVLCDVYMPEMDGIETIERLTREYVGVRIVAMSASFPAESTLKSLVRKLGAVGALAKPFTRVELLAAVQTAIDDTAWA